MITGVLDGELGKRAMELGASDYITKPLNLHYLETAVMVKMLQLLD
jgi:FixJ family two-component response regulator